VDDFTELTVFVKFEKLFQSNELSSFSEMPRIKPR
jgi:hypothetical protein